MELKIEPTEQVYLPSYINYVLPPTPSGSSTDTAPSPPHSEHVEHKMNFYNDYYNTQLHNTSNLYELGVTNQDKGPSHQDNSLHITEFPDAQQLYKATTQQHPTECELNQTQYQPRNPVSPNHWPNQAMDISAEQLQIPLTSSPNVSSDDQLQQINKGRRRRTQYTSFQIIELEKAYQNARYLTTIHKMELSKKLQLDAQRIKVWYQNRRMKDKKRLGVKTKGNAKNKTEEEEKTEDEVMLSAERPRTSKIIEIKPEPSSASSSSVNKRLLNHSVLAKGYRSPVFPALANYQSCFSSPYHWNGIPYSPSVYNGGYPVTNKCFSQYQGEQYNAQGFFNPQSSYQYNVPTLHSIVRNQEQFNDDNGLNSREDSINFAIAQEFLAKTIQF